MHTKYALITFERGIHVSQKCVFFAFYRTHIPGKKMQLHVLLALQILYNPFVTPIPLKQSINSNFEADVLETEATAEKKESRLVISIFELSKTARSGLKVPR